MKNSRIADFANREESMIWRPNDSVTKIPGAIACVVVLCARVALALTVLAACVSVASAASGIRTFGDWIVGCDNTKFCRATTSSDGRQLVLELAGGPNATPTLRFITVDDRPNAEGIALSIDGGAAYALPASIHADRTTTFTIDRKNVAYIALDDLSKGRALRFGVATGHVFDNGSPNSIPAGLASMSIEGLSATLHFIDEVQGRLDTVTALSRRGPKPASAVPDAPNAPALVPSRSRYIAKGTTVAPPRALIARYEKEYSDCERSEGEGMRLAKKTVVYFFYCGVGAYNPSHVVYLLDERKPAKNATRLETVDEKTGDLVPEQDMIFNMDYSDGKLTAYYKARGLGDCGNAQRWVWNGKKLQLESYLAMPICGGLDQDNWIALWRTREK